MRPWVAPNEKPSTPMRPSATSARSFSATMAERIVAVVRAGATRSLRHSGISGTKTSAPLAASARARRSNEG